MNFRAIFCTRGSSLYRDNHRFAADRDFESDEALLVSFSASRFRCSSLAIDWFITAFFAALRTLSFPVATHRDPLHRDPAWHLFGHGMYPRSRDFLFLKAKGPAHDAVVQAAAVGAARFARILDDFAARVAQERSVAAEPLLVTPHVGTLHEHQRPVLRAIPQSRNVNFRRRDPELGREVSRGPGRLDAVQEVFVEAVPMEIFVGREHRDDLVVILGTDVVGGGSVAHVPQIPSHGAPVRERPANEILAIGEVQVPANAREIARLQLIVPRIFVVIDRVRVAVILAGADGITVQQIRVGFESRALHVGFVKAQIFLRCAHVKPHHVRRGGASDVLDR